MQFRKQKTLVQVMRYKGYDAVKKQPQVEMVGTISLRDYEFTKKDTVSLDKNEQYEIDRQIDMLRVQIRHENEVEAVKNALESLARLRDVSPALLDEFTRYGQQHLHDAMKVVEKSLKRNGFSARAKHADDSELSN
jgi:hypothetical protein